MKKIFGAIVLFAILSASNIFGYGYYTELIGGYTSVNMSKVNSELITNETGTGIANTQIGDAMYMGVDAMYIAPEGLGLHFRLEYVGAVQGEKLYSEPYYNYSDTQISPYMVPLMLGLSYTAHGKGVPFTLTAGIFGGVADGYIDYYQHNIVGADDYDLDVLYEGWGFCGEAMVDANFWFTKNLSFGLNAGYRVANIPELTSVSRVYDSDGYIAALEGSPLKGASGSNVAADFSGFIIGVNLTYRFEGAQRRPHEEVVEYGW
jgi:hypothetical protein